MSTEQADLRHIIAQMRAGDPAAMADFVNRYEKPMRRVIRRKLGKKNGHAIHASDVFQSALTGLIDGLHYH